jgi:subtilase family serine protease
MSQDTRRIASAVLFASLAVLLIAVPAFSANSGRALPNVQAQMLGAEEPSKQISVTFWLNQHDKAGFDELVRQMYDRNSPNFHKWLTAKEYVARFAPTAAEMAIVKQHLAANNLKVVSVDKFNLVVTARGTVADVQRATGVQLNRVMIGGQAHRLPSGELAIPGLAGKLVSHVQGLNDFKYESHAKVAKDPDTGKPVMMPLSKATPMSTVGPATQYFNANCFPGKLEHEFTDGLKPPVETAHYSGSRYGDNITNGRPNLPPCGYDAPQLDSAYGLTALYKAGLDGTGQTVVIVDAYGSDSITSDANIFSSLNGLPALVPGTNFNIYYPGGPTSCTTINGPNTCLGSWDIETSLDVEWAHSVAPGATIDLLDALSDNFGDLDVAVLTAVEDGYGPVISNSYGQAEVLLLIFDEPELGIQNAINQLGAAFGESVNYSSGDSGDYLAVLTNDYGIPVTSASSPASSPYATAVGGTSLFVTPAHQGQTATIKFQTGWGTNITKIATPSPNPPLIPPFFEGFEFGAGGGESYYFLAPAYQSSLGYPDRVVPDIAMVADPYTGVEIIDTEPGPGTFIEVIGGTSLACPTFSGIWAIANQAAPYSFIGQAAPILYGLPAGAITDILAVAGSDNVTGYTHVVHGSPATVDYTAAELVAPLDGTTDFVSALYNSPKSTSWYVLGFGLDSSLMTAPGWDNVTGLGTPNGATFISDVAASIP